MEQRTRGDVTIEAPWRCVLDAIVDLEAYPQWASQFTSVTVLSRDARGWPTCAELVMDAGPVKDTLQLRYVVNLGPTGGRVSWGLQEARQLKALGGAYVLAARSAGTTHVAYELQVDPGIPLLTALRRKAERIVVDTALSDLKVHVEHGPRV